MVDAAERLATSLDAAVRMALLEALSDAAAEITAALDGTVGRGPPAGSRPRLRRHRRRPPTSRPLPPPPRLAARGDRRRRRRDGHGPHHPAPPGGLKQRAEAAATTARQSLNTWLVDAVRAAADGPPSPSHRPRAGRQAALGLGPLTVPPAIPPPPSTGDRPWTRSPPPKPPRLSVDAEGRTVSIETVDGTQTTVEITPLNDHDVTLDALLATTVDQRGDDVFVHVPGRFSILGRTPKLAITITAPHDARLAVKTGSADVVATGRFGTSEVQLGQRRPDARRLHRLAARQRRQRRRSHRVGRQGRRRQDGSGDVDIVDVEGDASITSGSGDIVVGGGSRGLVAKTGSGNITVGSAPPDLRVTTASGDIRIDVVAEGEVQGQGGVR